MKWRGILYSASHNWHKEPWKSVAPSVRNNIYTYMYSNISILAQSSTSIIWQVDKELWKEYAYSGQSTPVFIKHLFTSSYNVLPISNNHFTIVQYTHCKYFTNNLPAVYSNDVYIFLSTCSKTKYRNNASKNLQNQESEQNCMISVRVLPPCIKQYKCKHQV